MQIIDIMASFNKLLAGDSFSYSQAKGYLDFAIDTINETLDSTFPAFSELDTSATEYAYFPDNYIRTVVIVGAAYRYYTVDEEGIDTAPAYAMDFNRGLFLMQRDYMTLVPTEYQKPAGAGVVTFTSEASMGERGVYVDGNNFRL